MINSLTSNTNCLLRTLVYFTLLALISTSTKSDAQVVLFETNLVDFRVKLNPTGDPNLQPLVDNFLSYVQSGRYNGIVINRAVDDFVLQMASFVDPGSLVSGTNVSDFVEITKFDPVTTDANMNGEVDFDTTGISNTRGEIALALSGGGPNTGTSSFYINLNNNAFLDAQGFVPFARVVDMTPIDQIMALDKSELDSGLTFSDVPVVSSDSFLVINQATVIPEPCSILMATLGAISCVCNRRMKG